MLRHKLLIGVVLACTAVALALDPVAQDPVYHLFSDARTMFGIPNFWNVASNLPFLIIGSWGLLILAKQPVVAHRLTLNVFFAGLVLTAAGSTFYHLEPDNFRLMFDRIPMTICFASLFVFVLSTHLEIQRERRWLIGMILMGAMSVIYWYFTENQGEGDLRLYGLVQFAPMLLIPLIIWRYPTRTYRLHYVFLLVLIYGLAKIFEFFDASLLASPLSISGHSLKHIFAAFTGVALMWAIKPRRTKPVLPRGAAKQLSEL